MARSKTVFNLEEILEEIRDIYRRGEEIHPRTSVYIHARMAYRNETIPEFSDKNGNFIGKYGLEMLALGETSEWTKEKLLYAIGELVKEYGVFDPNEREKIIIEFPTKYPDITIKKKASPSSVYSLIEKYWEKFGFINENGTKLSMEYIVKQATGNAANYKMPKQINRATKLDEDTENKIRKGVVSNNGLIINGLIITGKTPIEKIAEQLGIPTEELIERYS
jgi:hypothetical protein